MADRFSQGFKEGQRQANAGESREIRPNLLTALVSRDVSNQTYMEGVKKGYEVAMEAKAIRGK